MPIGLTPERTIKVYLSGDLGETPDKDKCPHFNCRFLTCADALKLDELLERLREEADANKANALLDEAVKVGVTGWGNMGRDVSEAEMFALLTVGEKWELVLRMQADTRLAEDDRRSFGLAQRSGPVVSAPNVETPAAA